MKKTLLISGLLLAVAASTAMAGGINLSWQDCGSFGTQNRTLTCGVPAGNNVLVASYDPNFSVPDFFANEISIDITFTGVVPSWWQMVNAGSCRSSALTLNSTFGGASCADNFLGSGLGSVGSYVLGPNTASLICYWAIGDPGAAINAGTEYYATNVVINNTKTAGTGSCSGCELGACIVLKQIRLAYGPSAQLIQTIQAPLMRNWVTWQGATGVPLGCPGATPTSSRTWGQVKSLYR